MHYITRKELVKNEEFPVTQKRLMGSISGTEGVVITGWH